MKNIFIEPAKNEWEGLLKRPLQNNAILETIVQPIIDDVRANGDEAIIKYNQQFSGYASKNITVSKEEMDAAEMQLPLELKEAILLAQKNIASFHRQQTDAIQKIETTTGVFCWRKAVGIDTVGLYIPGGTAPLFSTLLMLAVPAKIAGCKNIIVCTPPSPNGNIHPAVLFTAKIMGIDTMYKTGGAQAIAAMAYGTPTIKKCNKIFGPGNQYVTCAKQLVNNNGVAIDMPAGPSEVAVYADESCRPEFVAADLLSQAEHGEDSQVILVASGKSICEQVQAAIQQQLELLPRKNIAAAALEWSRLIVLSNTKDAFGLLNEYAPEHLIIASESAPALSEMVTNAGSVFLGNYSPEAAGDYASGTNHTLPTNGYAKAYSGLSVDSFVKKITFQQISEQGLRNIGNTISVMAEAEGLQAHKNAVTIRLKKSGV